MYLEIFLADFAVFRVFLGISRDFANFAGPRPREISEALLERTHCTKGKKMMACSILLPKNAKFYNKSIFSNSR